MKPQFSTDPGSITDFTGVAVADIFNESIMPRVNSLSSVLEQSIVDLDTATAERRQRAAASDNLFANRADDTFLADVEASAPVEAPQENYDAPLQRPQTRPQPAGPSVKSKGIKLSNYGYNADSSPDYNSNVLKIGNRNNKLVDGVSAALTGSLAKRFGLKAGQEFEAVTADGKVLRRRYDDTVPTTYKGKPLPETIDLYELGGNNKFGGKVIEIRPL